MIKLECVRDKFSPSLKSTYASVEASVRNYVGECVVNSIRDGDGYYSVFCSVWNYIGRKKCWFND